MGAAGMTSVPLRIGDDDWNDFGRLHGRARAAQVRGFIAWQLHRPGAPAPVRPPEREVPPLPPLPGKVVAQFTAWYRRQPGAELPARPSGETTARQVRVPREDWREFTAMHGGKASEAVRMFIAWQLHRPGARLPPRLPPP